MVTQRFAPEHLSGAPLQALHLARALRRLGHDVSLLTTRPRLGAPLRETFDGVPVRVLPVLPGRARAASSFAAVAAHVALRVPPGTIVHAHAASSASLGAVTAARARGLPSVLKPSRAGDDAELAKLTRSRAAPLLRALVRAADRLLVLDDDIERELLRLGASPARLVRFTNGVDLERFRPPRDAEEREALRRRLSLPPAPLALFAGQLVERKGIRELLAAWPWVAERVPGATLLLVGQGPYAREVRDATARGLAVRLLPAHPDLAPLYRVVDVLVLPSRSESFGNVVTEAWASGVPVAATRVGVLCDDPPEEAFFPIEGVTPQAIADALIAALLPPAGSSQRRACRGAASRFDLAHVAARVSKLYAELP